MPGNSHTYKEFTDIAKLNHLIETHVRQHMPGIELRFDEPDPANPPTQPTLNLFMYLIHEDLSIRQNTQRDYDPKTGSFTPEIAYIRCLYLVTYWDNQKGSSDAPGAHPDSPTVINLTNMLKVLLCMRNHIDFKGYMLRIIEPEALNSLGNFWQALDNKPRAIMNFAVTLPISISHPGKKEDIVPPVQSFDNQLVHYHGNSLDMLETCLFNELHQALDAKEADLALKKVVINIHQAVAPVKTQQELQQVEVIVAGVTFKTARETIESCIASWKNSKHPCGDQKYQISSVQCSLVAPEIS
ncbi:hypothetical protein Xmau_03539 [Xenorhabdus mauleonii]|uniref:Pvc16 N-terminal domain-containing protein n=1 Tax=Xenorhabdus mauleonii TaxID=351675 RepID=A0A1I3WT80_9GAMM|nr:Pvc16 family protein [Xenorhabdus mauleonii]PHM38154.1 hypothetical protein Xmau_03539 [Xenorhabdus mauleonii]SFK10692.1 Protein of unknown function [Xenorhabdus mauleonii]